ncbi:hypothetical protein ACEWY4_007533 [Coilia grayii]|uniref:Transposase domain-containing protein n=1 Tax=Coilia grayii TaxID=363190 RepID=A0ABD1KH60_9TELE
MHGLPKDPRTLLQTKTRHDIKNISGGSYYHFGFHHGISCHLDNKKTPLPCPSLRIQVNIDGLPLYKSSNAQFWPILGLIECFENRVQTNREPFVIGIYFGNQKPTTLEFLDEFINDTRVLERDGFFYQGASIAIALSAVFCDAPARAFIRRSKGHTGFYSCHKCHVKGATYQGRMTFPQSDAPPRLDSETFDEFSDEQHFTGFSPFNVLTVGIVTQFPHDYMHVVCLGVVRKLLYFWMRKPLHTRVGTAVVQEVSTALLGYRSHFPTEFNRKPRALTEFERWKATELRSFLLYTGPASLKGRVSTEIFNNFMLLSVAMTILLSVSLVGDYTDYAHTLLLAFVKHCSQLYGREYIGYNMHALLHLSEQTTTYGALNNLSCFPFENFLGQLKTMIRKPNKPLEQIIRRLSEKRFKSSESLSTESSLTMEHFSGPVPPHLTAIKQFRRMCVQRVIIQVSASDSCVELAGRRIVVIQNIIVDNKGEVHIVFRSFLKLCNLFEYPLKSSEVGIYHLSALSPQLHHTLAAHIQKKYVLLPIKDGFAGLPMLHQ